MPCVNRNPNPVFEDDYRLVRELLLDARRRAGFSQRRLGRLLGRSASHICMIEVGQRRVDLLEFHKMALVLGEDPRDLFGRLADVLGPRRTPP